MVGMSSSLLPRKANASAVFRDSLFPVHVVRPTTDHAEGSEPTSFILPSSGRWNKSVRMNSSVPDDKGPAKSSPPAAKPPPIYYDLGKMLKSDPQCCRINEILRADTSYLSLDLMLRLRYPFESFGILSFIKCVEAVDYSIRPPNPSLLMGGPLIEYHEQHPLLAKVSQTVPNTDGMEEYDPPVKFGVLVMDQTHIIAGKFALHLDHGNWFECVSGWSEQERQHRVADLKRGLEWMEQYRLPGLKGFSRKDRYPATPRSKPNQS
jgi:hypothetical protein